MLRAILSFTHTVFLGFFQRSSSIIDHKKENTLNPRHQTAFLHKSLWSRAPADRNSYSLMKRSTALLFINISDKPLMLHPNPACGSLGPTSSPPSPSTNINSSSGSTGCVMVCVPSLQLQMIRGVHSSVCTQISLFYPSRTRHMLPITHMYLSLASSHFKECGA